MDRANLAERSLAEWCALYPELLEGIDEAEAWGLAHSWEFWARPSQLAPPGQWTIWAIIAGRGFGKTRSGAEWIHSRVRQGFGRIHLVGRTAADYRDVMIEGESGILATVPPGEKVDWVSTRRRLEWRSTGAVALAFSAEEPDQLRGPQCDTAWADEPSTWDQVQDASGSTAWDNLLLGLRLGPDPRAVATMTPRPIPFVRDLMARDGRDVRITRGSTFANVANLAPGFVREIVGRFSGSRLGRQEIYGEVLDDVEGALWTASLISRDRLERPLPRESYDQVVVGVDPAVGIGTTGIVVVGRTRDRAPDESGISTRHLHVLEDCSVSTHPAEWGRAVARAARKWGTTRVVAEQNQGGAMVKTIVANADPMLSVTLVQASESKRARAEPIAQLSEQGRLHLVGVMPDLEAEMVAWTPEDKSSPDRLDAMVWAATALADGVAWPSASIWQVSHRILPFGGRIRQRDHLESLSAAMAQSDSALRRVV